MRIFILTLCISLPAALFTPARSQSDLEVQIDELVTSYTDLGLFSGSVLVADEGEVFKQGYGLANHSWEIENTPGTRFQIASLTKSFTAVLILQMAESGLLNLEAPLTIYLPDYPADYGADITIRQLLAHTSGIPDYTGFSEWADSTSRIETRPSVFLEHIAGRPLEFEPGTRFGYSNSNYYLLGIVIENVTSKTYGRVLQEQILVPGRLENTGYLFDRMVVDQMASGYERVANGVYEKAPYQSPSTAYSAGGIYSTVEDLYRWDQLLYTDRLLTGASRNRMFSERRSNYGYGWVVGDIYPNDAGKFFKSPFNFGFVERRSGKGNYRTIWHWGSNPGYNALLVRVPENRWTIVILENQSLLGDPEGTRIYDIAGEIYELLDESR
ncbi:MAG: serine hydrolase domain-containing protein [Balneolaceae bacterium]|nr:serine hydrolase domain-containing protein [Balneolaceae bacterium]